MGVATRSVTTPPPPPFDRRLGIDTHAHAALASPIHARSCTYDTTFYQRQEQDGGAELTKELDYGPLCDYRVPGLLVSERKGGVHGGGRATAGR